MTVAIRSLNSVNKMAMFKHVNEVEKKKDKVLCLRTFKHEYSHTDGWLFQYNAFSAFESVDWIKIQEFLVESDKNPVTSDFTPISLEWYPLYPCISPVDDKFIGDSGFYLKPVSNGLWLKEVKPVKILSTFQQL